MVVELKMMWLLSWSCCVEVVDDVVLMFRLSFIEVVLK